MVLSHLSVTSCVFDRTSNSVSVAAGRIYLHCRWFGALYYLGQNSPWPRVWIARITRTRLVCALLSDCDKMIARLGLQICMVATYSLDHDPFTVDMNSSAAGSPTSSVFESTGSFIIRRKRSESETTGSDIA